MSSIWSVILYDKGRNVIGSGTVENAPNVYTAMTIYKERNGFPENTARFDIQRIDATPSVRIEVVVDDGPEFPPELMEIAETISDDVWAEVVIRADAEAERIGKDVIAAYSKDEINAFMLRIAKQVLAERDQRK